MLHILEADDGPAIIERFWKYVDRGLPDECWVWVGSLRDTGYGQFNIRRFPFKAHRVSFALHFGWEPPHVCHKCDNPPCVNPRHLFGGTPRDNARDAAAKGRFRNQLTPAQRSSVLALVECGMQHRAVARQLGCSKTTVGRIARAAGIKRFPDR
jgi:hypothetical protein